MPVQSVSPGGGGLRGIALFAFDQYFLILDGWLAGGVDRLDDDDVPADLVEADQFLKMAVGLDFDFFIDDEDSRSRVRRPFDDVELVAYAERLLEGEVGRWCFLIGRPGCGAGAAAAGPEAPRQGERSDVAIAADRGDAPVKHALVRQLRRRAGLAAAGVDLLRGEDLRTGDLQQIAGRARLRVPGEGDPRVW